MVLLSFLSLSLLSYYKISILWYKCKIKQVCHDVIIIANEAAGLSDEEVVDDIMTVYLVMDNMSKQLGSLFVYLINEKEVYELLAMDPFDLPEIKGFKARRHKALVECPAIFELFYTVPIPDI